MVDLTTAPPQVHRGASYEASPTSPDGDDELAQTDRPIASVGLDGGGVQGDPLLRMVRAAVGRAAEGSSGEDPEQEASAS